MSDEKTKKVDFIAKSKSYMITLKPIKQSLAPSGVILLEDPGVDIVFSNKRYSTSDPKVIEALKANAYFNIDFWIEKEMSDAVKAKISQTLGLGPVVKSGAMDSLDVATTALDAGRRQLDADRAVFAKEKAAFDAKNKTDSGGEDLPSAEETGEAPAAPPASKPVKPKTKPRARRKKKK